MSGVKRIYVEKKPEYAGKARELKEEIRGYLGIEGIRDVRVFIRYDVENISDDTFERACHTVFSEPPVDDLYLEKIDIPEDARVFGVEYLPGQYDQRADSAVQCIQFLKEDEEPIIRTATVYMVIGSIGDEELEKIADFVVKHDIYVVADEIYENLFYSKEGHTSIASLNDEIYKRTITVNGLSKSYAMTGWRLGFAVGPETIVPQMLKLHQYAIMCAPTTSQYAGVEALKNGDDDIARMREAYNQRRRFLIKEFNDMGLKCFEPLGAFYVFPNITITGMTSDEFANKLLAEEKLAVVPGTAFGECGEGFIRVSYAYSLDELKEAIGRIRKFVERHHK